MMVLKGSAFVSARPMSVRRLASVNRVNVPCHAWPGIVLNDSCDEGNFEFVIYSEPAPT